MSEECGVSWSPMSGRCRVKGVRSAVSDHSPNTLRAYPWAIRGVSVILITGARKGIRRSWRSTAPGKARMLLVAAAPLPIGSIRTTSTNSPMPVSRRT